MYVGEKWSEKYKICIFVEFLAESSFGLGILVRSGVKSTKVASLYSFLPNNSFRLSILVRNGAKSTKVVFFD